MSKLNWDKIAAADPRVLAKFPDGGDFVAVPCTRQDCPNKNPHLEIVEVIGINVFTKQGDYNTDKDPVFQLDSSYLSEGTRPSGNPLEENEVINYNSLDKLVRLIRAIPSIRRESYVQAALHLASIDSEAQKTSTVPAQLSLEKMELSPMNQYTFSEDRSPTPAEFINIKKPQTGSEKVICLVYYLTHYKKQEFLTEKDIIQCASGLENVQIKLSIIEFALQKGFLERLAKGTLKLSRRGEALVRYLPDRDKAYKEVGEGTPRKLKRLD